MTQTSDLIVNLPLRHTVMTLPPYKALTTLICFQKPLRLHIGERSKIFFAYTSTFPASSLLHTKTPENE